MDVYGWLLFTGLTAAVGVVIVGLLGVIRQQNSDFEQVLAKNEELDELLNDELAANEQLMLKLSAKDQKLLEQEFEAACVTLRPDELEIVPMRHWIDTLPVRPAIEV